MIFRNWLERKPPVSELNARKPHMLGRTPAWLTSLIAARGRCHIDLSVYFRDAFPRVAAQSAGPHAVLSRPLAGRLNHGDPIGISPYTPAVRRPRGVCSLDEYTTGA